ncbi:unnamed protein product [Camellia sinensis]
MLLGSVDGVACLFWFCFVPPINLMNDWKLFSVPGFSQQLNRTGLTVTIKKIRLGTQKEGVNFTALGEIKLLKELQDPNIIEPIDAFHHKGNLHLVFEFMETDLEAVIRDRNIVLLLADVKSYLQMTLMGLAYFHKKWVLHRYMKPNNLLIGPHGRLKLGDFGLARLFGSQDRRFIHQVFARWYRAPELLFGAKAYGPAVDVWAAACIFAELLIRQPFLQIWKLTPPLELLRRPRPRR